VLYFISSPTNPYRSLM